jgi:hypothetical protein
MNIGAVVPRRMVAALLAAVALSVAPFAHAQSPEEWVRMGEQVHGGFGTLIALDIRIGLDARAKLNANARELDVTYFDTPQAPCPCVADGVLIATSASPGQKSLRGFEKTDDDSPLGVVELKHKKTGTRARYVIPYMAMKTLAEWNKTQPPLGRYREVMNAPADTLYRVEMLGPGS